MCVFVWWTLNLLRGSVHKCWTAVQCLTGKYCPCVHTHTHTVVQGWSDKPVYLFPLSTWQSWQAILNFYCLTLSNHRGVLTLILLHTMAWFYVIYRYVISKWRSIKPVEINQYDSTMDWSNTHLFLLYYYDRDYDCLLESSMCHRPVVCSHISNCTTTPNMLWYFEWFQKV